MLIRAGYEAEFLFEEPTPLLCLGWIHPSLQGQIRKPEQLLVQPAVPVREYIDIYGNRCSRMVVSAGRVRLTNDAIVQDSGLPDIQVASVR